MFAAQARDWRGSGTECATSVIAVRFNQRLAYLLCDRSRARRIFVSHQQQRERDKRWIAVIASMANLLIIEAAVILGAGMPQRVVMRMISLNQNAPRQISASGAPGHLGDQLEGAFSGAKVRQSQTGID